MADEEKALPSLIDLSRRVWRVRFARGFLDADAGRDPSEAAWPYLAGWRSGELRRRLMAKAN